MIDLQTSEANAQAAQEKYFIANGFFDRKDYAAALTRGKEAFKIMQDNNLVNHQTANDIITLMLKTYLGSAKNLAEKEKNFELFKQMVPEDHPLMKSSVISYLMVLSVESLKGVDDGNSDPRKAIDYARQALVLAQTNFPQSEAVADVLKISKDICFAINKDYVMPLNDAKDYGRMTSIAKKIYEFAIEFFPNDQYAVIYAQNLGVGYHSQGINDEAKKYFEKTLLMLQNIANSPDKDQLLQMSQSHLNDINKSNPAENIDPQSILSTIPGIINSVLEYFNGAQYNSAFKERDNAYDLLKNNSLLNTPQANNIVILTEGMYNANTTLKPIEKQWIAQDLQIKEVEMYLAGNLEMAGYIFNVSSAIKQQYVDPYYNQKQYANGVFLANTSYNSMNVAYPDGHPDISIFEGSIGEGYIRAGQCKMGLPYIENGLAIEANSAHNDTNIPFLQNLKNQCSNISLKASAVNYMHEYNNLALQLSNTKAFFDNTCDSMGMNPQDCLAYITGDFATQSLDS